MADVTKAVRFLRELNSQRSPQDWPLAGDGVPGFAMLGFHAWARQCEHENETIAHDRIQGTFHLLSERIQTYGGIAHELRGDGLLAEFHRASNACATDHWKAFSLGGYSGSS